MNKQCARIALTAGYGLAASALWYVSRTGAWSPGGPSGREALLWLVLAGYGLLLARWAGVTFRRLVPGLALLLACVLAGPSRWGIVGPAVVGLAWARSGACFPRPAFRALAAEASLCLAGVAPVLWFAPREPLRQALCLWIFFLAQALYFVWEDRPGAAEASPEERFVRAEERAARLLERLGEDLAATGGEGEEGGFVFREKGV